MTHRRIGEVVRAPRGAKLTCRSWLTEAAFRMIQNNLDPEVAENPAELVVYGGIGKAARNWECFDAILETLKRLGDDESLLIQSGKPVAVFKTHADAPRVLIANSNLVPKWATWDHFNELDRKGLMMYGQMTAGSWIYIGSQGIVQGTYETFAEAMRQHYDEALAIMRETKIPVSVGLLGNAAEILPEIVKRGVRPDLVTDQTSAHDLVNGYLPSGWSVERWDEERKSDPKTVESAARASIVAHVRAMLELHGRGIPTVDYGNNIRQVAKDEGVADAFAFPGFVPAYIRPLFCEGKGPFRWVALSGDPEDIYRTDAKVKSLFPRDKHLHRWLEMARERISFQGLPARICWLGLGERHLAGLAFNEMVAKGELKAPIVIGRDHLDTGSVASPNRETESMLDGSDAVSDWPLLNALLSTAGGATWVSIHHGGGVGMGYSQHAGVVIVCDGPPAAAKRIERVLWNDPALGVVRHADAGYEKARRVAKSRRLKIPL